MIDAGFIRRDMSFILLTPLAGEGRTGNDSDDSESLLSSSLASLDLEIDYRTRIQHTQSARATTEII
ncbi:hypothetical protein LPJ63_004798 [Coemansia sp. RSA 2711]|nr:hypothetical protein LPJ63_004798 [Coemansia sp. RSA 2711]